MRINEIISEDQFGTTPKRPTREGSRPARGHKTESQYKTVCEYCGGNHEQELDERGKASRALCISSKPDSDLGASQLASCKSQGLRAREGKKSHKLGKGPESRVKVGGHKIKGKEYGGPLPDWS
jgi:hypothetical protein